MRRLVSLALVCALIATAAAAGAGPALANPMGSKHAAAHRHGGSATSGGGSVSDAVGNEVINDCQSHGQFTRRWTHAELEKARSMLSAATNQYSDCQTVINKALVNGIKVSDVSGGSGGGSGTTIVIVVVAVLVALAALLGGLALRRRRGDGGGSATAA